MVKVICRKMLDIVFLPKVSSSHCGAILLLLYQVLLVYVAADRSMYVLDWMRHPLPRSVVLPKLRCVVQLLCATYRAMRCLTQICLNV